MTNSTFFFIFVPILAVILLTINIMLSPHNPYQEKNSAFECGLHSLLGQSRTQFSISLFIFALLSLLFDLEIIIVYPNGYVLDDVTLILILSFLLIFSFSFTLGKQMNRAYENSRLEFFYVLRLINLNLVIYPFLCILAFIFLIPCLFSDKLTVFFTPLSLVYAISNVHIILAIILLALGKITSYTYAELKSKLKRVLIHIIIWAICALIKKKILILYFYLDPKTWHYWLIGALSVIFKKFFFSPFTDTMAINGCLSSNSTIEIAPNSPTIGNNTTNFMVSSSNNSNIYTNNTPITSTDNTNIHTVSHKPIDLLNQPVDLRPQATNVPKPGVAILDIWAEIIEETIRATVAEMRSGLPEHRIDGHNQFTRAGYVGGGFHDVMDEKEKKNRADYNNPIFKPFTDNLADYLEGYKGQVNKSGFPRMDHTSLRWYV